MADQPLVNALGVEGMAAREDTNNIVCSEIVHTYRAGFTVNPRLIRPCGQPFRLRPSQRHLLSEVKLQLLELPEDTLNQLLSGKSLVSLLLAFKVSAFTLEVVKPSLNGVVPVIHTAAHTHTTTYTTTAEYRKEADHGNYSDGGRIVRSDA